MKRNTNTKELKKGILVLRLSLVRDSYMQWQFIANLFDWSGFLKVLIYICSFLFSLGAKSLLYLWFTMLFMKSSQTDYNLCIVFVLKAPHELSKWRSIPASPNNSKNWYVEASSAHDQHQNTQVSTKVMPVDLFAGLKYGWCKLIVKCLTHVINELLTDWLVARCVHDSNISSNCGQCGWRIIPSKCINGSTHYH